MKEIYSSGELTPEATLQQIWKVQREGTRDVRREIEFYNLDAITLKPTNPAYAAIVLEDVEEDAVQEIAELVEVLGAEPPAEA